MSDDAKSDAPAKAGEPSKRMVAAILAIVLGGVGAHRFYLGDTTGGLIRLASSILCLGWLIGLIEGIIYITKSDEEFTKTYVVEKKAWF